jgi:hypothetical protein
MSRCSPRSVSASVEGAAPFFVRRVFPAGGKISFSSHSTSPEGVLTLAAELFRAEPEAWVLGIRGYEFDEFGERLSEKARANLAEAVAYEEPLDGFQPSSAPTEAASMPVSPAEQEAALNPEGSMEWVDAAGRKHTMQIRNGRIRELVEEEQ